MTIRAVLLGLLLGLAVATLTYFNDNVIRQTQMIGNHLPASIYGTALLLLLAVNPLLRAVGLAAQAVASRWRGTAGEPTETWGDALLLKPAEIAVILAVSLPVCAWPGSNLLRYFPQLMAIPAHRLPVQPAWQAAEVMSYVPGQSPRLTVGYVHDFPALADALRTTGGDPILSAVRDRLPAAAVAVLDDARNRALTAAEQDALVAGLNAVIEGPPLPGVAAADADAHALARANRQALDAALPGLRPMPTGKGVLLQAHGREDQVIAPLMSGAGPEAPGLAELPWDAWWPTLRLWGGGILCAALATLCLILIVHPQWAHRELLRYPTVEFVHAMTRWSPGRWLPDVASSKLFWIGVVGVAGVHLINGLHQYFPEVPEIMRVMPFGPLRELFPNAARADGSNRVFQPWIFPSVIGFGFFVTTRVSMSVGLSLFFWVLLGAVHLSFGVRLDNTKIAIGGNGTALRFGAYVGMTLMILYYGRRYYAQVVRGAVGLAGNDPPPAYAVWAARLAPLLLAMSVYLLVAQANMSPLVATLFVGFFVMMLVVLARINAETGLFYAQPDWLPGVAIAGLFGAYGLGAEGLIVMLIASQVFAADPREGISPYLANALRLGDRIPGLRSRAAATPGRLAPLLAGMIVVGLVAAIAATLYVQYDRGMNPSDGFATGLPIVTLNQASDALTRFHARGELSSIGRLTGLEQLAHMQPDPTFLTYASAGFLVLLACAIARTRLPWWPIHPVLFLVWGTYPANYMAFSFLIAAAVKSAITRVGGSRAVKQSQPLMVGLIAGDLLMIILWSLVGTIYYLTTGLTPPTYRVLPI